MYLATDAQESRAVLRLAIPTGQCARGVREQKGNGMTDQYIAFLSKFLFVSFAIAVGVIVLAWLVGSIL